MSAHSIEQSQTDRPGRRLTLKLDSVSFQSSPRFLIKASRSSPPNAIPFAMPLISSSTSFAPARLSLSRERARHPALLPLRLTSHMLDLFLNGRRVHDLLRIPKNQSTGVPSCSCHAEHDVLMDVAARWQRRPSTQRSKSSDFERPAIAGPTASRGAHMDEDTVHQADPIIRVRDGCRQTSR